MVQEILVKVSFSKYKLTKKDVCVVEGDYNATKLVFEYEEDISNKHVRFKMSNPNGGVVLLKELTEPEVVLVGYDSEGNACSLFDSPGLYPFELVLWDEKSKLTSAPGFLSVSKRQVDLGKGGGVDQYLPLFDEALGKISLVDNLDISVKKVGNTTTFSVTNLRGETKTASVSEGVSHDYAHETFGNVLYGEKCGKLVTIDDASTVPHRVRVYSESSKETIVRYTGKNCLREDLVLSTSSWVHHGKYNDYHCPLGDYLFDGVQYTFSFDFAEFPKYLYLVSCPKGANFEDGKKIEAYLTGRLCDDNVTGAVYSKTHTFVKDASRDYYLSIQAGNPGHIGDLGYTLRGFSYMQLEVGPKATEHELYENIDSLSIQPKAWRESLVEFGSSTLNIFLDDRKAILRCVYPKDINKAFAELKAAIISLGGNV